MKDDRTADRLLPSAHIHAIVAASTAVSLSSGVQLFSTFLGLLAGLVSLWSSPLEPHARLEAIYVRHYTLYTTTILGRMLHASRTYAEMSARRLLHKELISPSAAGNSLWSRAMVPSLFLGLARTHGPSME